jgi:selenocysteine-specific elongation factor
VTKSRLEAADAQIALDELIQNGQLILLEAGEIKTTSDLLIVTLPNWNTLNTRTLQIIEAYHKQFPLRRGIPREELKSKLKLAPKIFNAVISLNIQRSTFNDHGNWLALPNHEIQFNGADQTKVKNLMRKFEANPYATPSVKECQAEVGDEVLNALIELGELKTVSAEVIFRKKDYDEMVERIRAELKQKGSITLGEVRDMLNTTRKYIQALLEHLDAIGVTMRDGDARKLRK